MSATNKFPSENIAPSEDSNFGDLTFYLDLIDILSSVDPEMQLQRFRSFILVALYPDLNTQQLARKAKMTSPSMSRNLSSLGEWNPLAKKEGYGLVCGRDLRDDRRNKIHMLTNKGKEVATSLQSILRKNENTLDPEV